MTLSEKYRPRTLDAVVGQPKAVSTVRRLLDRGGLGGRAFWLSGVSGCGKTTLARIIAGHIADGFNTEEFDSGDCVGVSDIERLRQTLSQTCLGERQGRAVIVNEAHGLRKPVIRLLLGMLESLPPHVVFVFTTTRDGQDALFEDEIDAHPLLSRCVVLPLTNQGLARPFAECVRAGAIAEGLDGLPLESYVKAAQKCKNNCRALWTMVETGEIS